MENIPKRIFLLTRHLRVVPDKPPPGEDPARWTTTAFFFKAGDGQGQIEYIPMYHVIQAVREEAAEFERAFYANVAELKSPAFGGKTILEFAEECGAAEAVAVLKRAGKLE